MNIDFLNRTLSEANISPSSLKVLYNFDHRDGPFVTNEVFSGITQYETTPNLLIYKGYLPGIFLSCYGAQNQNVYNSGLFSGNTLLKVSDTISDDRFSLFLNYSNSQKCNYFYNSTGKNEILSYISSDTSSTRPFELIIGINNTNRIFLEFSGSTGLNHKEIYRKTIIEETADQNIISLTINTDLLDINYHNFLEEETYTKSLKLNTNYFDQNKNIYFGQKPTGKSDVKNTGFYGVIDDILIYNEYISPNVGQVISKNFIKTGELVTGIVVNSVTYNTINSGYINTTGIIGTGITGYQNVLYQQINLDCGDNCTFYIKSGVTGFLTGEKIEYKIVKQETIESSTGEYVIDYYDLNYGVKFSKNKIVFNQPIDSKDIFEINYYNQFNNLKNLNYSPTFNIYSANENLSGNKFLLFLNGVNIDYSGYLFLSGRNNQFQLQDQIKDNNDLVKYYRTDETLTFIEKLYTGGHNISTDPFFTFSTASPSYNFYLNGVKLISGNTVNMGIIGSSRRVFFPPNSPTGIFYAIRDYNAKFQIGSGLQKVDAQNYVSKNIWLNGILQEKNDKYILSSCVNNSLYGDKSLALPQDDLFDEEYFRFASGQNDTDLDYDVLPYLAKANITGDTQKNQINSFVKELKRINAWNKFQNIWILKSGYNFNGNSFYDLKNPNFSGNTVGTVIKSLSGCKPLISENNNQSHYLNFQNYPMRFTGNWTNMFLLENQTGIPNFEIILSNENYEFRGFRMGYPGSKEFALWSSQSVPPGTNYGFNLLETNVHGKPYSFITAGVKTNLIASGMATVLVDNKNKVQATGFYYNSPNLITRLPSAAGGTYAFANNIAFFALSYEDLSNDHSLIRDIAKNTIYSNLDF